MNIDPNLLVPDKSKSLIQGAIIPLGEQPRGNWYLVNVTKPRWLRSICLIKISPRISRI